MKSTYNLNGFENMGITGKVLSIIGDLKKKSIFFNELADEKKTIFYNKPVDEKTHEKFESEDILPKTMSLNVKSKNYYKISENLMKIHENLNKILENLNFCTNILTKIKNLNSLENLNKYYQEKPQLMNIINTIRNESERYFKNSVFFCYDGKFDNYCCLNFIEYLDWLNVKCELCLNFLQMKLKKYQDFGSNIRQIETDLTFDKSKDTNIFLQRKRENN